MGHQLPLAPCTVPKLDEVLDQVFLSVGLGCSPVLVDQSAEDSVASDRGVEGSHGGRVMVGRVLAQALVRAVVIEMVLVLVHDGAGVPFVEDQQPVGALVADTGSEEDPARIER